MRFVGVRTSELIGQHSIDEVGVVHSWWASDEHIEHGASLHEGIVTSIVTEYFPSLSVRVCPPYCEARVLDTETGRPPTGTCVGAWRAADGRQLEGAQPS